MTLNEKEQAYTELLNQTAEAAGMIFVQESGEGHDLVTDTMYLEDVSGWLCPKDTPVSQWRLDKYAVMAEWEMHGDKAEITFKPIY